MKGTLTTTMLPRLSQRQYSRDRGNHNLQGLSRSAYVLCRTEDQTDRILRSSEEYQSGSV